MPNHHHPNSDQEENRIHIEPIETEKMEGAKESLEIEGQLEFGKEVFGQRLGNFRQGVFGQSQGLFERSSQSTQEGLETEGETSIFEAGDLLDESLEAQENETSKTASVLSEDFNPLQDQKKTKKSPHTSWEKKIIFKAVLITSGIMLLGQVLFASIALIGIHRRNPQWLERVGEEFFENSRIELGETSGKDVVIKNIVVENETSQVVAIAEKVGPSVVGIKVTTRVRNSWLFGGLESTPEGSGIVIREDGYILTNDHVIETAMSGRTTNLIEGAKIEVILQEQDDALYLATVVGRDSRTDLAVLKINKRNLSTIEFGNSDEVRVGELAVAIGNPGGLEYMGSVTAGIISGLNRTIPLEDGKQLKLIQTDAAINPGNSGGALVNGKGQLIGVNAAKIGGASFEGLGFAIPVNVVKDVAQNLIEFRYVRGRPLLGIMINPSYTEEVARENDMPVGVLVSEVSLFTGAFDAGIKPRDVITKFNGKSVKNVQELNEIRDQFKPGDVLDVEVYRDRKYLDLKLKLSEDKG
jgi:serine protease Do